MTATRAQIMFFTLAILTRSDWSIARADDYCARRSESAMLAGLKVQYPGGLGFQYTLGWELKGRDDIPPMGGIDFDD
jgi:hypothetical protein